MDLKAIYRLLFVRNNRSFELLEVKPLLIGSTIVYNIQRNKLTINKLKIRTLSIDWNVKLIKIAECPF